MLANMPHGPPPGESTMANGDDFGRNVRLARLPRMDSAAEHGHLLRQPAEHR